MNQQAQRVQSMPQSVSLKDNFKPLEIILNHWVRHLSISNASLQRLGLIKVPDFKIK